MSEVDYSKGVFTNTENGLEFTLAEERLRGPVRHCEPHTSHIPIDIDNMWRGHSIEQQLRYNSLLQEYYELQGRLFHPPQTRWFMPLANSPDEQRPICEFWLAHLLKTGVLVWKV